MNNVKRFGLLVCLWLGVVHSFTVPFEGLYKLDIIHFNDFHARFEETSVASPTCRFNNNSCLGGFPRLYHEVMTLRREKPNAILLNAGDSFQGTYWYTLLKWNITQEFMNLMPHDAHAIGNHEFDDGPENLSNYLRALKAPVLAANMDSSQEPSLQGLYKNHTIVVRNKRKIGIIGLTTIDTKILSSPGKVVFTNPGEAMMREAKILTEKHGVDIIVVLSHCGFEMDKQLAMFYGDHVDLIVGGHSHSLLWNGPAPSNETVVAPYPVFVQSAADKEHRVMIVQASAFTKYMGNLTLLFDYKGDFVDWQGGPIFLDRSIEEDESIKKQLAPYAEIVHKAENVVVGESVETLHFEDCVFGECKLGDLLVDSMNEYAKSHVTSDLEFLAFMQCGNIRSSITEGSITEGEIFELLPYYDRVETFELHGHDVAAALERGVSDAWAFDPFKGPWMLQVAGLQVTYNVSLPEGKRVTSAFVGAVDSTKELRPNHLYQVTAPSYLADGGDGYTMFQDGKIHMNVIGRDQQILTEYIRKNSPLKVKKDGRITINK